MKKLILLFCLMMSLNFVSAQSWCDSTLTTCENIFIDSILFTESSTTGNRIHIDLKSTYQSLYAPSFILCVNDKNIEFLSNEQSYFSLFGPVNVLLYYEFSNFDLVSDSLDGRIVVDNTNNEFPNCLVTFNTPVQLTTTGLENEFLNNVTIYPNPVSDYLFYNMAAPDYIVQNVQLIDYSGKVHQVSFDSERIDLRRFPSGIYTIQFESTDHLVITQTIVLE